MSVQEDDRKKEENVVGEVNHVMRILPFFSNIYLLSLSSSGVSVSSSLPRPSFPFSASKKI